MGTTSEELKKLYKKLGGKDPKVAGFSAPGEILNAINEIPLPTEYELPTVTTEDAGDVLVVNEEGKWDKGEAGSGVIPNPEGEATADLTKLGINNNIYGIPTGLPAVTAEDNGKIAKVIDGAWDKADFDEPVVIVNCSYISYPAVRNRLPDNVNRRTIINWINQNKIVYLRCNNNTNNTDWVYMIYSNSNNNWSNIYFTRVTSSGGMLNVYWCNIVEGNPYFNVNSFTILAGGGLPEVTSEDNGDVLAVVEGAWAKAAMSKDVVIVNGTTNAQINKLTLEIKLSELEALISSGKYVVIMANTVSGAHYYFEPTANDIVNYFTMIMRTTNSTLYWWIEAPKASDEYTTTIYKKTVNDPA